MSVVLPEPGEKQTCRTRLAEQTTKREIEEDLEIAMHHYITTCLPDAALPQAACDYAISSLHPRNLRAFHRVLAGPTGFCSPLCSSVVLTRKTVGSPPFAVRRFAEKRAFCSSAFMSRHTSASGPVFPGFVIRGSFSRLIIRAIMYPGGTRRPNGVVLGKRRNKQS